MKPEIGTKVYCIYKEQIIRKTVEYLGTNSFLSPNYSTYEDSWEWWYEDYFISWFLNLEDAKNALLELGKGIYGNDMTCEIEMLSDDCYTLIVKENGNEI